MSFSVEDIIVQADDIGWGEDEVKILEGFREPETLEDIKSN